MNVSFNSLKRGFQSSVTYSPFLQKAHVVFHAIFQAIYRSFYAISSLAILTVVSGCASHNATTDTSPFGTYYAGVYNLQNQYYQNITAGSTNYGAGHIDIIGGTVSGSMANYPNLNEWYYDTSNGTSQSLISGGGTELGNNSSAANANPNNFYVQNIAGTGTVTGGGAWIAPQQSINLFDPYTAISGGEGYNGVAQPGSNYTEFTNYMLSSIYHQCGSTASAACGTAFSGNGIVVITFSGLRSDSQMAQMYSMMTQEIITNTGAGQSSMGDPISFGQYSQNAYLYMQSGGANPSTYATITYHELDLIAQGMYTEMKDQNEVFVVGTGMSSFYNNESVYNQFSNVDNNASSDFSGKYTLTAADINQSFGAVQQFSCIDSSTGNTCTTSTPVGDKIYFPIMLFGNGSTQGNAQGSVNQQAWITKDINMDYTGNYPAAFLYDIWAIGGFEGNVGIPYFNPQQDMPCDHSINPQCINGGYDPIAGQVNYHQYDYAGYNDPTAYMLDPSYHFMVSTAVQESATGGIELVPYADDCGMLKWNCLASPITAAQSSYGTSVNPTAQSSEIVAGVLNELEALYPTVPVNFIEYTMFQTATKEYGSNYQETVTTPGGGTQTVEMQQATFYYMGANDNSTLAPVVQSNVNFLDASNARDTFVIAGNTEMGYTGDTYNPQTDGVNGWNQWQANELMPYIPGITSGGLDDNTGFWNWNPQSAPTVTCNATTGEGCNVHYQCTNGACSTTVYYPTGSSTVPTQVYQTYTSNYNTINANGSQNTSAEACNGNTTNCSIWGASPELYDSGMTNGAGTTNTSYNSFIAVNTVDPITMAKTTSTNGIPSVVSGDIFYETGGISCSAAIVSAGACNYADYNKALVAAGYQAGDMVSLTNSQGQATYDYESGLNLYEFNGQDNVFLYGQADPTSPYVVNGVNMTFDVIGLSDNITYTTLESQVYTTGPNIGQPIITEAYFAPGATTTGLPSGTSIGGDPITTSTTYAAGTLNVSGQYVCGSASATCANPNPVDPETYCNGSSQQSCQYQSNELKALYTQYPADFSMLPSNIYGEGIVNPQAAMNALNTYEATMPATTFTTQLTSIEGANPMLGASYSQHGSQQSFANQPTEASNQYVGDIYTPAGYVQITEAQLSNVMHIKPTDGGSEIGYAMGAGGSVAKATYQNFSMGSAAMGSQLNIVVPGQTNTVLYNGGVVNRSNFDGLALNTAEKNSDQFGDQYYAGGSGIMSYLVSGVTFKQNISDTAEVNMMYFGNKNNLDLINRNAVSTNVAGNSLYLYTNQQGMFGNPYMPFAGGFMSSGYSASGQVAKNTFVGTMSITGANPMANMFGVATLNGTAANPITADYQSYYNNTMQEAQVMKMSDDGKSSYLFGFGHLYEQGTFLGSPSASLTGGMTDYLDIKIVQHLGEDVYFMFNSYLGRSRGTEAGGSSFLNNISMVPTQKLSFGMLKDNILHGSMFLTFTEPLRALGGQATVEAYNGAGQMVDSGTMYSAQYVVEKDCEIGYNFKEKDYSFGFSAITRKNPYGIDYVSDNIFMVRMSSLL